MAQFEYLQRSGNLLFADPETLSVVADLLKEKFSSVEVTLSENDCEVAISNSRADDVQLQNILGAEGWELVTVDAEGDSYYKRQIE